MRFPILLLLTSMFIVPTGAVLAGVPKKPEAIKIVMDNNYPPYAFQDSSGKLQGVLVDQWQLWSKKTGIRIDVTGLNWGEAQSRMQAGEFDVIDTIFRNSTRERIYDFGSPYAEIDFNIFFHQDISGIREARDIKGFVVAVKSGGAAIDELKKHGIDNIMQYESDEKVVQAAHDDNIKVFALGHQSAAYFLNKYRIADRFRETGPLFTGKFHRAVRKGNTELLQIVEKGFTAISPEEYRTIEKRWYGSGIGDRFPVRYLGYAAVFVTGVIVVLITWNRTLNRAVVLRTAEREKALRETEDQRALLNALINGTSDAVFVKDTAGRYLLINREVERLFALEQKNVVGKDDTHFFPSEQADMLMMNDRETMNGDGAVTKEEHLHTTDGDRIYLSTKGPIHGADGTLCGLFGISRDITDRMQAEEALRASEERYRSIIDSMQDVYFRTDAEGLLIMVSPSGPELLGYDCTDAMLGLNVRDTYYFDPSERDRLLAELLKKGSVSHYEITLKRRDGSPVPVATSSHLIFGRSGELLGVEGIFRDMRENRLLQEEREKSQRLESLGVLAGGIAHDFNNILTGILGNVTLARLRVGDDHPAAVQLDGCEKAAFRATELTHQLLTFAKGGAPVLQVVDIRCLLEESISFVLHGSNVVAKLELPSGTWNLHADAGQISQVINNLLINARQAMPGGGYVTLAACNVEVSEEDAVTVRPGRYVRLAITDCGCGIPAEHLPRIFDPYFTTKSAGTGLGLASAFSIVKRHGGMISVSSTVDEGSTFTVLIPAAEARAGARAEGGGQQLIPNGEGIVLVMDDEKIIRDLARSMLNEIGYEVETCAEGSEAVRLHHSAVASGRRYAAIILDLTIPGGMGGKEAAEIIRKVDTETPLIVSSGYSQEQLQDTGVPLFTGRVKKPYTMRQIAAEMSRVVAGTS